MERYAIYWAPTPASALWRFGSSMIGYDAETRLQRHDAPPQGFEAGAWHTLTAEPRRYGFHATLKAPFELAAGADAASLASSVALLAAELEPCALAGLEVATIGRFVALVPSLPSTALQALAARVVTGLDHLRAPLGEADRARRLRSPLTARQVALLERYGYPYVLEEFRFHMTLTGPIEAAAERSRAHAALSAAHAGAVPPGPVTIDQLVVYRQASRDDRFHIIARHALSGRRAA